MSTHDVPGAKATNKDQLAMGCWAEHEDGSLIFVESVEGGTVVYVIFDVAQTPPVEYRDAVAEKSFKEMFSWKGGKDIKWTWHDKTPFPWTRVIDAGGRGGPGFASADHLMSAAEQVAHSRRMRGKDVDPDDYKHLADRIIGSIQNALERLRV